MNDIATEQEQIEFDRMKYYKDCIKDPEIPGISQEKMKKNKEKREKILKKKFKEITESEGRYIAQIAENEDKNDLEQKHEIENFEGDLDFNLEDENKNGKNVYFYRYNPNDEDKDINEYSANVINPIEIKKILKGK